MTEDDILAAADSNMVETWRAITAGGESARIVEDDEAALLSTGAPVALLNPAFVIAPPADPEAFTRRVTQHYESLGLPFVLYFRDATAPGLGEACLAAGLVEHYQPPLMVLEPIPAAAADGVPADLEIRRVDYSSLEAYQATFAAGFGMPGDLASLIFDSRALGQERLTGFLATVAGEPVATSGLFLTAEVAGIYNVSTLSAHRGRGFGAAVTWAAVGAGGDAGATRAILQSSKEGLPVYLRMGFREVDHYRQFEPRPS